MRRWFDSLPIHRKLVCTALLVSGAALALAMVLLLALDLARYRSTTMADTASLAEIIAENSAAAVVFKDPDVAGETLATTRVRAAVRRACLFLPDGTLFAGYARTSDLACERGTAALSWSVVAARAPVRRNGELIGMVYIERDLAEVWARVGLVAIVGTAVLLLAIGLAFLLAERLNRTVSTPIATLAAAARTIGHNQGRTAIPMIPAAPDEVGELVGAFTEMLRRVQDANSRLTESNDALQREVDERRRVEAEREDLLVRERDASRLKDEFLAAVSHELRTPLNAILGWTQILGARTLDEETMARAIASITRNARAQTRVIDDLVDVSRIVTGKLNLRFDLVDLRDPVEAAIDVIRPAAEAKGVRLNNRLPCQPCLVNGDRDRLQQVAWNLVSNAVKFTPAGGSVFVGVEDSATTYRLDVADTGTGIRLDFVPYVFDRFRQADGSTAREHSGLGLGLSIVKELTELHGGSVVATSAGPGLGATFSVRLPQVRGMSPADASGERETARWSLDGVRVLAVDDNADALEVLTASLARSGAIVRVAPTGADALRELDQEPFDVLVCDLAMPQMDGFELLKRIRSGATSHSRVIPAIALTAHASEDYRSKTHAAGFLRHISKPYHPAELANAISAALEAGEPRHVS